MGAMVYRELIVMTYVIIITGSKKLITMSNVTGVDNLQKHVPTGVHIIGVRINI